MGLRERSWSCFAVCTALLSIIYCWVPLFLVRAHTQGPAEIEPVTTIGWIDDLASRRVDTECSTLKLGTKLCVHKLRLPPDYAGRSDLATVWVSMPASAITMDAAVVKLDAPLPTRKDDIAVLSGGFWKGSHDVAEPDGLVIENGTVLSSTAKWPNPKTGEPEGGVVFQDSDSSQVLITPISKVSGTTHLRTALQSRPLLIENGHIAIKNREGDHLWNRACIGLDRANNLVLIIATRPNFEALKQYEFAYLLRKLPNPGGPIEMALGMDGAYAPALFVSHGNRQFGALRANTTSFLRFRERTR
jgi:uncharacterized protein YigE (DUF2233 family)